MTFQKSRDSRLAVRGAASTPPKALPGRGLKAFSAGLEREAAALAANLRWGSGVGGSLKMLRSDHAPEQCQKMGGLQMSDLSKALADVRAHLRMVLISSCPDEHKVPLRRALEVVDNAIGNPDGWCETDTYAGVCDGERWVETVEAFEAAATRHRQRGPHRKSAAELADRMAATTHDVMPHQMMAATEFLMAEFEEREDWDPERSEYCRTFDEMCERFPSGYSPKDATAFLKDLVARLSGA
jgi:hypothetical protein